jgi:hypothetical protein
MPRLMSAIAAGLLLTACSSSSVASVQHSPSPVTGGLSRGLIAYVADAGVGVLDPATGKSTIVAPLPPGAFRVAGPVWGPAPNVNHPVIYFTVHDDRPAERRTTAGVVPYDWLFRVDPFTGVMDPLAASQDSMSEGPIGLVANSHYLALTMGCCATYEVDALDLTQPAGPLKVLSRPPDQAAFFTEGAAPGDSGLIAVRGFATGAWYWLNAQAGVVNPFPLKLGADDGPIAISPDGTMAAIALPSQGAVIEPINSGLPLESPSSGASAPASPTAKVSPPAVTAPKKVNSKLLHPDGLTWSPDARELALAVNGQIEIYKTGAPDGAPATTYLGGGNVVGVAWSAPLADRTLASVKPSAGPLATLDALLAATKLPAAADTPANRPFTQIYLWQYDSTRASPIESITDATPAILDKYPPLAAGVVFHHWAPSTTWAMLGGCYRYRVLVTGSIPAVASTFGLASNTPCSAKPSPSTSPKASPT